MDYITIEIENNGSRLVNIGELYTILEQVKDNRQEKGKRYSIGILLIVVILAKLCGENTPYGIAEWAKMRGKELQKLFGYHRQVIPSNKTLQRLTDTSLEDEDLQATIRHYLHQSYGGQQSVLITIDGKTLRGIIPKGKTRGVHLLAAYLPEEGVVLLQIEVGQKDNEIMVAQMLLRQLDLKGLVVSGDAMFTQRNLTRHFHSALEKAGLPRTSFHTLRHTAATILLQANVHPKIVQEMLGHSTITLTLDTYSHVVPGHHEEAADEMEKIFG